MKPGLKVTKNTLALISREALNKGALFILLVLIGRFLGKEALGRYSLALAISQIFFLGAELGLNTLVTREVAREKLLAGKALFNIGVLRVILGGATMILIWFCTIVIGAKGETAVVIYLCGLSYFLVNIITLYTSIFRAFEKMELELFIAVVKNLIFIPTALWMLFNNIGLVGIFNCFLISNILALIIANIVFIRQIAVPRWTFDFNFLKEQLNQSLPLWIWQLFGISYLKIASILLFKLRGEKTVGLYNAGLVVVESFWVLAACFVVSIFPIMSRLSIASWSALRKEYLNGLYFITLIFLPLGLIIILGATYIVQFFYGESFLEIVPLLKLLTLAAILTAFDTHNGITIISIGKQFLLPFINGIVLLINFVLSIFFILRFDYLGAAYALIISEGLNFILMMAVLRTFVLKPAIHR